MAPFEHDHHADDEQTILSMEDQGEVARFLAEFGDDLVLDAAAMQQDLHSLMRDVRIQLVEHMVRTGEIDPDAADPTLEAIDIALQTDRGFTYDSIRHLLDAARAEHPGNANMVNADWTFPQFVHGNPDGVAEGDGDPDNPDILSVDFSTGRRRRPALTDAELDAQAAETQMEALYVMEDFSGLTAAEFEQLRRSILADMNVDKNTGDDQKQRAA